MTILHGPALAFPAMSNKTLLSIHVLSKLSVQEAMQVQKRNTRAEATDLIVHDVKLRPLLLKLAPCCAAKIMAGQHEPRKIVAPADSSRDASMYHPERVSERHTHAASSRSNE